MSFAVIPSLSMLCGAVRPSSSPCRIHRIVRDVLDNGLRILTERMTQVRSISIGVWLTRGSRHETAERGGIAHFVEHMLFKGTGDADRPRTSPRRSIRSAASSTRSPPRNTRATTSRCSTSTCRSPSTSCPTSSATRRSAPTTSSARRRSSSKRSRWSRTRPTISSTSSSRRGSGRIIRSAGRFSAPRKPSSRSTPSCCATTSANAYTAQNLIVVGGRQSRARARARAGRARSSASLPRPGEAVSDEAPRVVPKILIRNKELEQSHLCLGVEQLSAESRRSLCELRAEHAARRVDELAAVSERPREARPGLCGVQRPERLSRRRLVHDLRRLLERSGRRGDRSRASRSCAA